MYSEYGSSWAYDPPRPDHVDMFAAFGRASYCAQEFEVLLLSNLQYSCALAGKFASLDELDRDAAKNGSIPMGQVFRQLCEYLQDSDTAMKARIADAITMRNRLAHNYFRKSTNGIVMTPEETAESIKWCERAASGFATVCNLLNKRLERLMAEFAKNPDSHVPGVGDRIRAIERGEWPVRDPS